MYCKVSSSRKDTGHYGVELKRSALLFLRKTMPEVTRVHELDLPIQSIEALRSLKTIWVYLPRQYEVSINDVVVIYAGARTGEFLHPSVFSTVVVEIDQTIVSQRPSGADLHDRVRVWFDKPLSAVAL